MNEKPRQDWRGSFTVIFWFRCDQTERAVSTRSSRSAVVLVPVHRVADDVMVLHELQETGRRCRRCTGHRRRAGLAGGPRRAPVRAAVVRDSGCGGRGAAGRRARRSDDGRRRRRPLDRHAEVDGSGGLRAGDLHGETAAAARGCSGGSCRFALWRMQIYVRRIRCTGRIIFRNVCVGAERRIFAFSARVFRRDFAAENLAGGRMKRTPAAHKRERVGVRVSSLARRTRYPDETVMPRVSQNAVQRVVGGRRSPRPPPRTHSSHKTAFD